ncbi:aminopeptidase [Acetobacteraceae bacterium ESL0709]|nr:aminopeptidase [Acetobacteraceae bacterium ESL0697]MDF7677606.1 aminopeptidase [Acetobacteraceae bacterium ESL0709]
MSSQKFTHEQLLDRLGEVAVRVGLNLVPQQQLFITAPLESVPLVRRITEHAYKAGASLVTTFFSDDEITLARYRYASAESFDIANGWVADAMAQAYREGTARLAVTGGNPTLLKGQNPDYISRASKASSKVNRPAMEVITQFATNWTIVAAANPVWAKQVFPDLSEPEALEALWQGIFKASRVDHDDPVSVWQEHNRHLHERSARLNDLRFDALAFKGPGTDITIGLADGHFWAGGAETTTNNIVCNPNIPTEEVFTTPHCARVDGVISSTKPLFHQGSLIDGIHVRFQEGKIVEVHADAGQDVLERLLDSDEGARRLGEVALVPYSSPISQSGILYRNTLFDENASSHIALGQSYTKCMMDTDRQSEAQLIARGANQSIIHIDWMVGSAHIDVDGIKNGVSQPLMRQGEWV